MHSYRPFLNRPTPRPYAIAAQDGIWLVGFDEVEQGRDPILNIMSHEVCKEDPNGIGEVVGPRSLHGILRPVRKGICTYELPALGEIYQCHLDLAVGVVVAEDEVLRLTRSRGIPIFTEVEDFAVPGEDIPNFKGISTWATDAAKEKPFD